MAEPVSAVEGLFGVREEEKEREGEVEGPWESWQQHSARQLQVSKSLHLVGSGCGMAVLCCCKSGRRLLVRTAALQRLPF